MPNTKNVPDAAKAKTDVHRWKCDPAKGIPALHVEATTNVYVFQKNTATLYMRPDQARQLAHNLMAAADAAEHQSNAEQGDVK